MKKLTTSEEVALMAEPNRCQCDTCKRTARYGQIISKLDSEDGQRFMLNLYDELCHVEFEAGMNELDGEGA